MQLPTSLLEGFNMKHLKSIFLSLAVVLGFATLVLVSPVGAQGAIDAACKEDTSAAICQDNVNNTPGGLATNIINILLFVVGAVSVIMIIVGGIMYATSAGDSGQVTKAKNTLMYAVIGLVISFLAFAVVQFVLKSFIKP